MRTKDTWIAEVLPQFEQNAAFTKPTGSAKSPPAKQFLEAIYRLHFENIEYSCTSPLLPGLPALSLDESFVEMPLQPAETLRLAIPAMTEENRFAARQRRSPGYSLHLATSSFLVILVVANRPY